MNIKNKARYGVFFSKWILTITLIAFCLPCLSYAQNLGVVVFYREKSYQGSAVSTKIYANQKEILKVKNASKYEIKLPAGDYIFQAKPNMKYPLGVKIVANDTFFIKVYSQMNGFTGWWRMTLTDKKQGRIESDLLKEGRNK